MSRFNNRRTWAVPWSGAVGVLAICGSARAEVLFNSLDGLNAASFSTPLVDATFSTGPSSFRATDIALLLSIGLEPSPDETFTVSLKGGVPLTDVSFDPVLGLNVGPGGPALATLHYRPPTFRPVWRSSISTNSQTSRFSRTPSIGLTSRGGGP